MENLGLSQTHRDPASVPCRYIDNAGDLGLVEQALRSATRVAIDTETPIDGPMAQQLRVASIATRDPQGTEQAFVVDARDVEPTLLAPLLVGVTADAWNATFDARVLDRAVWQSQNTTDDLTWWDAQLADALLFQGRSGFSWYHGLAWATEHYLGIVAQGKGTVQLSYTATDDLTPEQIRYSADDAVETLWVGDAIRQRIADAGLERICDIENRARPFLDQMERTGLPFDWPGWQAELDIIANQHRLALGQLADLTGGGQGSLFDEVIEPTWNPTSDVQVRAALNEWAEDHVRAWTKARHGKARLLAEGDSVQAGVLREIGGELSETLLEFRNSSKILTTYGDSIAEHLDDDGRMRPQYLQVVGTNTGRLASRNPNAQNLSPRMKPYIRPASADRVFVHADLSQAELRFLAQVSIDEPLRAAFARGEDVHVSTAASMFKFDAQELKASDPARFKELRQIAKALNFGIAYGTGAAALARSLTGNGTPTTVEQGRELLAGYRATYPGTAAWAEDRIAEIEEIRGRVAEAVDWGLTLKLARNFSEVNTARREFRQARNRWPSAVEVAEALHGASPGPTNDQLATIDWVMGYSAAVVLQPDGQPFTFSSRTVAGRRQQFNLHVDRLFLAAALDAATSSAPALVAVRQAFEREHQLVLSRRSMPMTEAELTRQFEERAIRRKFIEAIAHGCGADVAHGYLARAAKERVSAMVNAWRNAPIQGGVADIMLDAYARLHEQLRPYPNAWPVQTVHDSVVIECDRAQASQIASVVASCLEAASVAFCPDVAPKADVDVRNTLADADIVHVFESGPSVSGQSDEPETAASDPAPPSDDAVELMPPVPGDAPLDDDEPVPVQLQLGLDTPAG